MGQCLKPSKTPEEDWVDIEGPVAEFLNKEYGDPNCCARCQRKCRYRFEVDRNSIHMTTRLIEYETRPAAPKSETEEDSVKAGVAQRELCLYKTEFKNSSSDVQQFTFKTQKTTTTRCEVSLETGFRFGTNVDFRIAFPGSINSELHVTKSTGQSFEEAWTWGVDNNITVGAHSNVEVQLVILEKEQTCNFTAESVIHTTPGITVFKKDRTTGRVLSEIKIPGRQVLNILRKTQGVVNDCERTVKYLTKGVFSGVYSAQQKIQVGPDKVDKATFTGSQELVTVARNVPDHQMV